MTPDYLFLQDLNTEVEIPKGGIVSRTLHNDDRVKIVLFGFDTGQELSEHTASMPAIIHFLRGEADVRLGTEPHTAAEGTWAWMPAQLPHTIVAKTPLVMLLALLKNPGASAPAAH